MKWTRRLRTFNQDNREGRMNGVDKGFEILVSRDRSNNRAMDKALKVGRKPDSRQMVPVKRPPQRSHEEKQKKAKKGFERRKQKKPLDAMISIVKSLPGQRPNQRQSIVGNVAIVSDYPPHVRTTHG